MFISGRQPVFLVDDFRIVREGLASLISELPNLEIVGQAELASQAVSGIRALRPTIVVLDISMPGGNGLEVLQIIKRQNPAPLVIMLTNLAQEQYRQKSLQLV